jgi:ABC-2 type transport system ATP-binding protein
MHGTQGPGAGLVVEGHGLTKWYADTTALDRVDITVGPGVVHGLVGRNGAGKTTLLSVLFGLVLPEEGTLRLFGRTRGEAGAHWLDGVGGFVETPRFYPYLTGRRNLAILAGLDGGGGAGFVDEMLDLVGLGAAGSSKVRGYSLGMGQRLGLAAALLRRPRLLILDEPTNGMDPLGIRDLRRALRQLADEGLTVVLSSHDIDQVEEICDHVTVLEGGSVAFAGTLEAMRAQAPDPAWRLRTSDDGAARAVAGDGADLDVSARAEGGLIVLATQERMDAYIVDLGRAGIAVRGLSLDVTPLASLFFRLTAGSTGSGVDRLGVDRAGVDP